MVPVNGFSASTLVLDSREAILALAPLLERLAVRCAQPGAMHWLEYFLDRGVLGRRQPRLVLFLVPEEDEAQGLRDKDVYAAALFFEYVCFGLRTGVVATGDAVGFNSVIAAPGQRARMAALAAQALAARGARLLVATCDEPGEPHAVHQALQRSSPLRWATRQRRAARVLPLEATFDSTLAKLGKSTRFNLRYYRRRLEREEGCTFVADAAPLLAAQELDELNRSSLNPVLPEEFARRVHAAAALPGSMLCGLRSSDGRWLSLVGGWRQGGTTVVHWQMNLAGFEKQSLGTVMRSYLLEHEIACGAKTLLIFGGTPHSMRHAFREDELADVVMERRGMRSSLLLGAIRMLRAGRVLRRDNFVLEALCSQSLQWQTVPQQKAAKAPVVLSPMRRQHVA